ncbi:MAG TPA: carbon-nitrogen hydrolase family protein [Gemmatales bacterium]|nr:carbon-nitrogen hydrolase family protein [Gemmatales bacterium]
MSRPWKVAAVQMDCEIGNVDGNLRHVLLQLEMAAEEEARLVVFPECALTGYCFQNFEQAISVAITLESEPIRLLMQHCQELDLFAVIGFLERQGDELFNSAVCIGPQGIVGTYRKTHLPFLGVDRFVSPGREPYEVYDLGGLKIGILICFDGSFPEPCRVLTLLGADLIVLPTNWPEGAWASSAHVPAMRALENHVYFLSCNRVGIENMFRFIGHSRLIDWTGEEIDYLDSPDAGMLLGEIDPELARQKHTVFIPGEYEVNRIAGRRPELYGPLLESIRI